MFNAILKGYSTIGSKDRLHRAKTIDLCQNPLTVRSPSRFRINTPFMDIFECRRNQNCRGRVRFPNGRSTTKRSLDSCVDLLPKARFTRAWRRPIRTSWLEAVGNLERVRRTRVMRRWTKCLLRTTSCSTPRSKSCVLAPNENSACPSRCMIVVSLWVQVSQQHPRALSLQRVFVNLA